MATHSIDRSRQQIDPRFDQRRLSRASVLIAGNGPATSIAVICAASLGFQRIVLVRDKSVRPFPTLESVFPLEEWFAWRYPDVPVMNMDLRTPSRFARILIGEVDAAIVEPGPHTAQLSPIVDSLPPESKVMMCAYGDEVTVTTDGHQPQVPALSSTPCLDTALLAAGLALGEVRRIIAPCADDTAPSGPITFELPPTVRRMGEVAVAGAGGSGSLFVPAAASACTGPIRVYDPDQVEETNLCRCPFLATTGINKAVDLASSPVASVVTVHAVPEAASSNWLDDVGDDCIAAFCTDSLASRKALNEAACRRGVPAVNMGTSLWGAVVNTITAESQCLKCRFPNMEQRIEADRRERRVNSCGLRPEASAVISNMIAAGAAAMVARRLPDPAFRFPGSLVYDAFDPKRLHVTSVRPKCGCFGKKDGLETNAI